MQSQYINATPQERQLWIDTYVKSRKATYAGKISLRKNAKKQWRNKVKRAELRRSTRMEQNLSNDTIAFLADLLNQVTLNVSADDFEETANKTIRAKRELNQLLYLQNLPKDEQTTNAE